MEISLESKKTRLNFLKFRNVGEALKAYSNATKSSSRNIIILDWNSGSVVSLNTVRDHSSLNLNCCLIFTDENKNTLASVNLARLDNSDTIFLSNIYNYNLGQDRLAAFIEHVIPTFCLTLGFKNLSWVDTNSGKRIFLNSEPFKVNSLRILNLELNEED